MLTINGNLEAGEAQGALRAIRARYFGAGFGAVMLVVSFLVAIAAIGAADFISEKVLGRPIFSLPIIIIAVVASSMLLMRVCQYWSVKRYRKNTRARGMPTNFRYSLSLADDQLVLETEWMRQIAPWSSVTEIVRSGNYWIFMVGFEPWFAPSRLFSNTEEECDFIKTSLQHLSSDARGRSQDAISFVGT